MLILDGHTHIFPEEFCRRREDFFADEPAFKLLYESPKAKMVGPEELIQAMDEGGVEASVVLGFPWRREKHWRRHHEVILEAMRRWPRRLIGFCAVHNAQPGANREVERCLAAGFRGVGELAFYLKDRSADLVGMLTPTAELCQHYGVPILLHATDRAGAYYPGRSLTPLAAIYRAMESLPPVNWILAHWGGRLPFYGLLKKPPEVFQRLYFDTAASPYVYRPEIYRLVAEMVGPEKIIFGSDYPLLPVSRYLKEMEGTGLPAEWQAKIMGGNLARLLGY